MNRLSHGTFSDELKANYHLIKPITEPTMITNKTATVIIHVYVSRRSKIAECGWSTYTYVTFVLYLAHSHAAMSTRFQKRYNSFRSFQGLNEFKLMNDLIIVPWSVLDACDDLNDVEHNFGKMLHAVWDKHAPVKQRLMQDAPLLWMTGDIACMMKSRDAAF